MGWLGPVIGDVQHEGWVVPVFADGAEGAGASGPRGVLVARKRGEGPCNGDRVRLTYPDDSHVVGIWQDDALVLDDGVVYSHVRGQVLREVLEEAEQWRPDAAIVGYAAACDCRWRGRPWTRVHAATAAGAEAGHSPEDGSVVDPGNRLIFQPGPYGDLDERAERAVVDEWREHIRPFRALEEIEEASEKVVAATLELEDAVRTARAGNMTWADIGRAAGISRQAANERWASRLS